MNQALAVVEPRLVKKKRRTYSLDFKRELVQKCRHPQVSIASVALEHGINTNLLNRWVKNAPTAQATRQPTDHAATV